MDDCQTYGGSQGVGSLVLTRKRHLNVKSDELIPAKESLFYHNRLDMKENVALIANEEKSTVDIVMGDSSTFFPSIETIQNCLDSATFVPLNLTVGRVRWCRRYNYPCLP